MGFIKAFTGAVSSTFADQWLDYYTIKPNLASTVVVSKAVQVATNNGNGENTKGNDNIISDGSKIVVPEGYALITVQDGQITGCCAEAGGYIFKSNDPNAQSIFAGDGIVGPFIKSTWEKIKFGGVPGSQHAAFYINLKQVTGIKFGTQEPVMWNDSYLMFKAGAIARGSIAIQIVDPLAFAKQYVPVKYLTTEAPDYDLDNDAEQTVRQLYDDFQESLVMGLTRASVQAKAEGFDTLDYINMKRSEFAKIMMQTVEEEHKWQSEKGIELHDVTIAVIAYDEKTQEHLEEVRKDDQEIRKTARMSQVFGENMQGAMAYQTSQALNTAAGNENGAMMGFMGMNMANAGGANLANAYAQGTQAPQAAPQPTAAPQGVAGGVVASDNAADKLIEMKKLLDAGVLTQEEFDAAKAKFLNN